MYPSQVLSLFKPQLIVLNFKKLWSIYTHDFICQGDKGKGKKQELENWKEDRGQDKRLARLYSVAGSGLRIKGKGVRK